MSSTGMQWATPDYTPANYVLMFLSVVTLLSFVLGFVLICIREKKLRGGCSVKKRAITKVLPVKPSSNFLVMEDLDQCEGTLPHMQSFVEPAVRSNVTTILKSQKSSTSVSGNRRAINKTKSVHATI